ncbi:Zinc/iron permease [Aureobasidium subglaciale]|nr:Zinc/iron permease [Aureobasidium subglaciale]
MRQEKVATWSDIPTSALRAELLRRQTNNHNDRPACGTAGSNKDYNMPLHVFALVLILVLSTLACSFPLLVRRVPRMPVPRQFLFLSRHFGTGVLIATAFVHLLPTAFTSLTDPCLPPFWNQGYPAMAGFIAMISVMLVVGVEMFFATKGAGHSHSSEYVTPGEQDEDMAPLTRGSHEGFSRPSRPRSNSYRRFNQGQIGAEENDIEDATLQDASHWQENERYNDAGPRSQKERASHSDTGSNSDLDLDELDELDTHTNGNGSSSKSHGHGSEPSLERTGSPSDQQQQQKMLLQCLLLEAGILFHSIFIGMAVSVATGTSFIVLLVAISFHQTFEGLALGSRIAAITIFPKRSPRPWLMALAYGTTTPLGQGIGLLVHNLYDPFSQTGLLMVGIMNAISSGLLLFAGLVELLAEDFLSDESYEVLRGRKRLQACGAVVAGSLLMALVGAWA